MNIAPNNGNISGVAEVGRDDTEKASDAPQTTIDRPLKLSPPLWEYYLYTRYLSDPSPPPSLV